jgi:hypothetical protein
MPASSSCVWDKSNSQEAQEAQEAQRVPIYVDLVEHIRTTRCILVYIIIPFAIQYVRHISP